MTRAEKRSHVLRELAKAILLLAEDVEDDKPIAMAEEPIALDPADGQVESQGEYESDQGDELPFRFSDTEDDDRPTA